MLHVIAVAYPTEQRAEQVMAQLQCTHIHDITHLENIVCLTKDAVGRLHVRRQPGTCASNIGEMMVEVLVVMLTVGLSSEFSTFQFDARFVNRLNATMGRASSAVLICMGQMVGDRVLPELSAFGGFALQTTVRVLADEESPQRATPTALVV